MNLFEKVQNKYHVWKLRKALVVCKSRVEFPKIVHDVAMSMEASLSMTEKLSKDTALSIKLTREELKEFVGYITQLHATKLSHIQEIKWAITAVMMKGKLTDDDMKKLVAAQAMASHSIDGKAGRKKQSQFTPPPAKRRKRKVH